MTSQRRHVDELNEVLRDTREALPLLRGVAIQMTAFSLIALFLGFGEQWNGKPG